MQIAIIIPARLASTRFPAKPLAPLVGADGVARPAISYTWAAAQAAAAALPGQVECVIATDDARIADACAAMGMAVLMTPDTCLNGTERCAAALAGLAAVPDMVVCPVGGGGLMGGVALAVRRAAAPEEPAPADSWRDREPYEKRGTRSSLAPGYTLHALLRLHLGRLGLVEALVHLADLLVACHCGTPRATRRSE